MSARRQGSGSPATMGRTAVPAAGCADVLDSADDDEGVAGKRSSTCCLRWVPMRSAVRRCRLSSRTVGDHRPSIGECGQVPLVLVEQGGAQLVPRVIRVLDDP